MYKYMNNNQNSAKIKSNEVAVFSFCHKIKNYIPNYSNYYMNENTLMACGGGGGF